MNRLLGALVAVSALAGVKFYSRASAHDDLQARLVELCAGNADCQKAVRTHYDACLGLASSSGGRQASKLDARVLVECVNARGGEDYFSVSEERSQS